MDKRGLGVFSILIILTALTIGFAVTSQVGFDIDKFKTELKWKNVNISVQTQPELGTALSYYINGIGASFFEITKWVAQLSYDNPNVPYKLLIILVLISLFMPIIWYGFLIITAIVLIIREWYLNRKEKKKYGETIQTKTK